MLNAFYATGTVLNTLHIYSNLSEVPNNPLEIISKGLERLYNLPKILDTGNVRARIRTLDSQGQTLKHPTA